MTSLPLVNNGFPVGEERERGSSYLGRAGSLLAVFSLTENE